MAQPVTGSVHMTAQQSAVLSQRRAAAPADSVWVAASAGTGKTTVLTQRFLRLLLAGCAAERLLCLTFTKAAAALERLHRLIAAYEDPGMPYLPVPDPDYLPAFDRYDHLSRRNEWAVGPL